MTSSAFCAFLVFGAAIQATEEDAEPLSDGSLVAELIDQVDPAGIKESVELLCGFWTRHTLSDIDSESRGIGAARRWLKARFESYNGRTSEHGRLEVRFEEFEVPKTARLLGGEHLVNVIATLPGTMPEAANRRYYVVGHYDSINGDRRDAEGNAPGANDDASGTAVVLEAARVLAATRLDATVVFLCTVAEEQGLVGARFHAESAAERGERILGVLSNDIVGDPSPGFIGIDGVAGDATSFVRVFSEAISRSSSMEDIARIRGEGSENDSASRQLARYLAYVAGRESKGLNGFSPRLVFRQDRFLRGGDHMAFNDSGYPAVRFSVPGEDYSRQHQNVTERNGKRYGDVPEYVDAQYTANVARLNIAAIVHLANAPSIPGRPRLVTKELATDTLIRWNASPEPDVAGYEIMIRETTAADWQRSVDAGDVTEIRLPMSKDNYFFAVRAYDQDGYRSPAGFCIAATD